MKKTEQKQEWLWLFLWGVTLVSTLGSLFFSEILHFVPCELCWVQRILMYPLVIIYGVAMFQRNIQTALPGLILSSIGLVVSTYHYLIQKLPTLQEAGASCGDVPCNLQYTNYLGFITIPFLAGLGFLLVIISHVILLRSVRR
ncbi:MAG TPA: disulfide oxidoreductase [Bacillota bacterium]|nr:disulfide oxidoreductase [Bacillota bacterium]